MGIRTQTIQQMLAEAAEMAIHVEKHPTNDLIEWYGSTYTTEQFLLRAANLSRMAAEKLNDEAFQKAGFPAAVF